MTIPNCISLFRIVLVPCFAWIFLTAEQPEEFALAAVLLVVSGISDLLDGWIARRFHMTSKLGKILDPAADKLTLFGVFVCMWIRYPEFWPLYALFISKEVLMAAPQPRNRSLPLVWKTLHPDFLCGVGPVGAGYPPGFAAAAGAVGGHEPVHHRLFCALYPGVCSAVEVRAGFGTAGPVRGLALPAIV